MADLSDDERAILAVFFDAAEPLDWGNVVESLLPPRPCGPRRGGKRAWRMRWEEMVRAAMTLYKAGLLAELADMTVITDAGREALGPRGPAAGSQRTRWCRRKRPRRGGASGRSGYGGGCVMMAMPESEPTPCNDVGLDSSDWPGPWGCGRVWWEKVDGAVTRHRCALSYDHVHYRNEPHVCTEGHRCDVEKPRRRWRDQLLRRPVEELPLRRGGFRSDLDRHLEDPKFRRSYVEQSLRIQAFDKQADADGDGPTA